MKKMLLTLGTIAVVTAPITTIISCGTSLKNTDDEYEKEHERQHKETMIHDRFKRIKDRFSKYEYEYNLYHVYPTLYAQYGYDQLPKVENTPSESSKTITPENLLEFLGYDRSRETAEIYKNLFKDVTFTNMRFQANDDEGSLDINFDIKFSGRIDEGHLHFEHFMTSTEKRVMAETNHILRQGYFRVDTELTDPRNAPYSSEWSLYGPLNSRFDLTKLDTSNYHTYLGIPELTTLPEFKDMTLMSIRRLGGIRYSSNIPIYDPDLPMIVHGDDGNILRAHFSGGIDEDGKGVGVGVPQMLPDKYRIHLDKSVDFLVIAAKFSYKTQTAEIPIYIFNWCDGFSVSAFNI